MQAHVALPSRHHYEACRSNSASLRPSHVRPWASSHHTARHGAVTGQALRLSDSWSIKQQSSCHTLAVACLGSATAGETLGQKHQQHQQKHWLLSPQATGPAGQSNGMAPRAASGRAGRCAGGASTLAATQQGRSGGEASSSGSSSPGFQAGGAQQDSSSSTGSGGDGGPPRPGGARGGGGEGEGAQQPGSPGLMHRLGRLLLRLVQLVATYAVGRGMRHWDGGCGSMAGMHET